MGASELSPYTSLDFDAAPCGGIEYIFSFGAAFIRIGFCLTYGSRRAEEVVGRRRLLENKSPHGFRLTTLLFSWLMNQTVNVFCGLFRFGVSAGRGALRLWSRREERETVNNHLLSLGTDKEVIVFAPERYDRSVFEEDLVPFRLLWNVLWWSWLWYELRRR